MALFNDAERDLIEAAQMILRDGLRRLADRPALFRSTRGETEKECREARETVAQSLIAQYGGLRYETAVAVLIDAQGRLIGVEEFPRGDHTSVQVSPRLIAGMVCKHDAAAVLLAHNHPSGDCTPSREDKRMTEAMTDWLEVMDVKVIDHLVLTVSDWSSIKGEW
jgi:DNA repair protein RadC